MAREAADKEFQAMLAGALPPDDDATPSKPTASNRQRLASGAIRETTTEKAVNIKGKIRKVLINKEGQYIGDA